ncbi:sugar ABC transporter ATP-binding protein [Roseisolibacter sp. H3M3-2]|uniref:sugar ABC transporter ATP-binding protein n=1 Tax=Roseisolibacter sp. H3M3-2 TaxID=3031323 RepID=UPI0023DB080C|nr:sugar ABC transporter ATP-binding protein [Roseisolibacter sp. H3M3-2]MDF1502788.1 sugar ABC transporter ATP-binding protein [Roseisolibacter sp. H3M3-2]
MTPTAVAFDGVTKRFPGATALDGVTFAVRAGACHAVCGENGAGKSTLGKILAGLLRPDAGEVRLDGRAARFGGPRDALAAGVAIVHQELALCDNLSVAENLCMGRLPSRFGVVAEGAMRARARALLDAVEAPIDVDRPAASLSVAEQQVVQIAGAVGAGARVLVLDEPTSSLGEAESARLFATVARLKARGVTLLYVSHRLPEIFRLCDDVTVLRDGRHVETRPTAEVDEGSLVRAMIGRPHAQYFPDAAPAARGAELLRVEGLSSPGRFADVSFALHAGEVLGLAGLVGAGRSEVARALFGLDPHATGRVLVRGRPASIRSPADAMAHGIGLVPEDRKRQGLVLAMRAGENATLPTLARLARLGWVDAGAERRAVRARFEGMRVRATPESPTAALSGGNQQKIVLAKWLAADCDVLLLDEPTRGVDVGAKAEIHAAVGRLAADGAAVLLISSELPELLALASRVLVLRGGRVAGELSRAAADQEAVGRLMTGAGGPAE